jgi:16S rRNA (guanine1516-N2)-methyltransferase
MSVVVVYASSSDEQNARKLAVELGLSCAGGNEVTGADLSLMMDSGVLSIRDNRGARLKPLSIDFEKRESPSRKQLLGRAVGRRTRTVADATAGWGNDVRRLCAMGYAVTAIERSPVIAALLRNAADRAVRSGRVGCPPQVMTGDAIHILARHPDTWDCVYIDPMFPPKRRSSTLARRPLRLLRELVGDDPDRDELFAAAMTAARKRVVVKRPDHGAPAYPGPDETLSGKLVHYDLYFRKK